MSEKWICCVREREIFTGAVVPTGTGLTLTNVSFLLSGDVEINPGPDIADVVK